MFLEDAELHTQIVSSQKTCQTRSQKYVNAIDRNEEYAEAQDIRLHDEINDNPALGICLATLLIKLF